MSDDQSTARPVTDLPDGTIVWDDCNDEAATLITIDIRGTRGLVWADGLCGVVSANETFVVLR